MNTSATSLLSGQRARALLATLVAIGILLRVLLILYSPQPFGYVWDYYHEGVRLLFLTGHLPESTACWQCYHPPLFYVLGWLFYAPVRSVTPGMDERLALRALAVLSTICGALTVYYGFRLLRFFRFRGPALILGTTLLLVFPCLFISSYGAEADIVLTAIMSATLYYLTRYFGRPSRATLFDVVRLGTLVGLAAATKYSGLVGIVSVILVMIIRPGAMVRLRSTARDVGIVLVICSSIAGWKYVDNMRRYGTALFANGEAAQGFSLNSRQTFSERYEFATLHIDDVIALFPPRAPAGMLTWFAVYHSVPTTLHALAWSDMSFFSEPTRHGDISRKPYPRKYVPRLLITAVLVLGLVADCLAVVGFLSSLRHRVLWPVITICTVTVVTYGWWFVSQATWGLKTKYILFLLPPFALYATLGLTWTLRRSRLVGSVLALLMVALLIVTHVYLYAFAVGRLL